MAVFLALYAGATIGDSRLIAVTADAATVAQVAEQLLSDDDTGPHDSDLKEILQARRKVLEKVSRKANGAVTK